MTSFRRTLVALAAGTLIAPLLLVAGGTAAGAKRVDAPEDHLTASAVAVAWQRVAIRTIYTEAGLAPPLGALYLSFTSRAVYDATLEGHRHGRVAATAAVARAAHDVLMAYFPAATQRLDADLALTLAGLPDGRKADLGEDIGADAAAAMVNSRVGDGRGDTSIVYSKPAAPGVWQPPATGMALPWLGFVDPVIDVAPVALDGTDGLTSAAYTADWLEVRRLGSLNSTDRSADQTEVARFFANNPIPMYRDALCRYLDAEPLGLVPLTRMFARIDTAVATTVIETWRLKYDLGFWRPFQAIQQADTDSNPATTADAGWMPLIANPAYSDYTSGHASATAPFAEVLRQTLGDDVSLVLRATGRADRTYATLTALEHDALHARIWGGLHFRDAMDDGYHLGHTTAEQVMRALR
jgi:hypothetical protein